MQCTPPVTHVGRPQCRVGKGVFGCLPPPPTWIGHLHRSQGQLPGASRALPPEGRWIRQHPQLNACCPLRYLPERCPENRPTSLSRFRQRNVWISSIPLPFVYIPKGYLLFTSRPFVVVLGTLPVHIPYNIFAIGPHPLDMPLSYRKEECGSYYTYQGIHIRGQSAQQQQHILLQ